VFQLTKDESASLLLQFARAKKGRGGRHTPPYAFTELGVAMLSSVLNSERAVQINILIMRAFVRLRTLLSTNKELARHLDEVEARFTKQLTGHDRKLTTHEQAITGIFKTLRDLMNPPQVRAIGFTADLSKKKT
jgi:ORF6N domain-containing protein